MPSFEVRAMKFNNLPNIDLFMNINEESQEPLTIDASLLEPYVNFEMKIRRIENGKLTVFKTAFRKCKVEDFTKYKLDLKHLNKQHIGLRICPDMERLE